MRFVDANQDLWHAAVDQGGTLPTPGAGAAHLLTLEQWQAVRGHWPREAQAGVVVPNEVDVESIAPDLPRLALVALQFPKWIDGRAYSQARILRRRLRFGGEVRATGEVLVDMLPLLQRTGFDAVQLRADQSPEAGRRALRYFSDHYQGDARQTHPLYARSAA